MQQTFSYTYNMKSLYIHLFGENDTLGSKIFPFAIKLEKSFYNEGYIC
jgi:hypothetical protein